MIKLTTMTKEQFLDKWLFGSNPLLEADLDAVIEHEIAKAKEQFLDKYFGKSKIIPQQIEADLDAVIEHEVDVRLKAQPTNSGNRKILYKERLFNDINNKYGYQFTKQGIFHQWVTIESDIQAIIQIEDGTITTLPYFAIKFINI